MHISVVLTFLREMCSFSSQIGSCFSLRHVKHDIVPIHLSTAVKSGRAMKIRGTNEDETILKNVKGALENVYIRIR